MRRLLAAALLIASCTWQPPSHDETLLLYYSPAFRQDSTCDVWTAQRYDTDDEGRSMFLCEPGRYTILDIERIQPRPVRLDLESVSVVAEGDSCWQVGVGLQRTETMRLRSAQAGTVVYSEYLPLVVPSLKSLTLYRVACAPDDDAGKWWMQVYLKVKIYEEES